MTSFSGIAKAKTIKLYENHSHEVGSVLKQSDPKKYEKYESTDCITYVLNVLSHAYKEMGNGQMAKDVWTMGRETSRSDFRGTILAKRLVTQKNWAGIYVSPDSIHPSDGDQEHTYASVVARKQCIYSTDNVPLKHRVVNYNPTKEDNPNFQALYPYLGKTKLNDIDYKELAKIPFGFGLSRGGMHTWLFVEGFVYEVHWDAIGKGLYEKTALRNYPWLSSAIFVPQDTAIKLNLAKLKCAS
ncbi:hypothetical protein AHAT_41940 [Agarivorans sp. Toyoura001]|uniref:hypothetical protein n=1 Tax=Agarivorans sp. Toyoura001 TaxID=2283141 RepID=UPI0010E9D14C|nr:hypothetical protein [Agarivorans sp. Toyoura001]GDY28304.1 hypothetical protein AHAT_41940 [Agarivorans sp. Toyoura001]